MDVHHLQQSALCRGLGAVAILLLSLAAPAGAADLLTKAPAKTTPQDDLWTRDKLTGDWGGLRTALSKRGIDITVNYIGEVFGVAGGFHQGVAYDGRLEVSVDADFEKLAGWTGATAHGTFYQIHNINGLPALNFTGSFADPSNIEALPSSRLYTLWFQKNFLDDKVSIRFGQIAADDEFVVSPTASNLIITTFGFPALLANDMIQGGPVYPLPDPGVRLQVKPTEDFTFLTAVFSGAPAGADCTTNPQICNNTGTTFSLSGGVLSISEAQYAVNQAKDAKGLPGVYKLGGWYESASFADVHLGLSVAGVPVSLASPSSIFPLNHQGDWGIYGVADQMVWRAKTQSINAFLRAGASPADRNLVASYVDGGIGIKAPIPGRDDDVLTFGFVWSNISQDLAALDIDTQFLTGMFRPVHDHEGIVEADYSFQLAPWWTLQTDARYVYHPGGNVLNPVNPTQAIPDAFVFTVRNSFKL